MFAMSSLIGDAGVEHPRLAPSRTAISRGSGAKSGARDAPNPVRDPDLDEITAAWPGLSNRTKTQIKGFIEKHSEEENADGQG